MTKEDQKNNHWSEYAKRWKLVASPFKPVEQDIKYYTDAIGKWVKRRETPRVLILGVTPELFDLPWPNGTSLLAVDNNQAMIDFVWPGRKEDALCADWLEMNLPEGSRDVVLCDGGLGMLLYPQGQQQLVRILHHVLSDEGVCIFRLYVLPPRRESVDAILEDMLKGKIPHRAVLELRLAMALQQSAHEGVSFDMVWRAVRGVAVDLEELVGKTGWTREDTLELDAHKGATILNHYTTLDQVREIFCHDPGGFELVDMYTPDYALGDRCPIIVMRRRSNTLADMRC